MEFAVIDNSKSPMVPERGRGQGFVQRLTGWVLGNDYEFVRYDNIAARQRDLMQSRGLILSGSGFNFALSDGSFDRELNHKMGPVFELIRQFQGPVLGICFGHQLMALGEEYQPDRTEFGRLQLRNMQYPRNQNTVLPIRMDVSLRFFSQRTLWVQFHHNQEVVLNDDFLQYFDITARSNQCPVQMMQHKSREWFGVQFHPEIGVHSEAGEITRHHAAEQDGKRLLQEFVHYCLR
jgi:GMP synthase-like glutamine amidotransferase